MAPRGSTRARHFPLPSLPACSPVPSMHVRLPTLPASQSAIRKHIDMHSSHAPRIVATRVLISHVLITVPSFFLYCNKYTKNPHTLILAPVPGIAGGKRFPSATPRSARGDMDENLRGESLTFAKEMEYFETKVCLPVYFYNFVRPHCSLSKNPDKTRTPRIPAFYSRITDRVMER